MIAVRRTSLDYAVLHQHKEVAMARRCMFALDDVGRRTFVASFCELFLVPLPHLPFSPSLDRSTKLGIAGDDKCCGDRRSEAR